MEDKKDLQSIENIEIVFLKMEDYEDIKKAMQEAYPRIPNAHWNKNQIKSLIRKFPEGQVGIITGSYTFDTHTSKGTKLYGIDVFIRPKFRGLRLGRRLYDYRKELCEKLNLKGIVFGGRIPNYHRYSEEISPRAYIEKVRKKEIHDPVLDFQMSNDFHPVRVLKGYLEGDKESQDYAVLLEWDNVYYEKKTDSAVATKSVVRLGLVQWQMRYQVIGRILHYFPSFSMPL